MVGILATMLAESPEAIAAGQFTIPTIWAAGSVAGGAVVAGVRGGLLAAAAIVAADLVEVGGHPTQSTVHNIVLVVLLGGLVGLAVDLARTGLEREEQVLLERERLHERERIARVVHDGVLQSLAYIHRRGDEIGGRRGRAARSSPPSRSARCAASSPAPGHPTPTSPDLRGVEGAEVDLRVLLTAHERPDVVVAVPADPVVVDRLVAVEVDAAVAAALDNVDRHAGAGRARLAAARGRLRRHRARPSATTASAPSRPTCSGPPTAAGWASAPRSAAGSRTSAAPSPGRPAPAGAASCG